MATKNDSKALLAAGLAKVEPLQALLFAIQTCARVDRSLQVCYPEFALPHLASLGALVAGQAQAAMPALSQACTDECAGRALLSLEQWACHASTLFATIATAAQEFPGKPSDLAQAFGIAESMIDAYDRAAHAVYSAENAITDADASEARAA